jgi:hypothetical protein
MNTAAPLRSPRDPPYQKKTFFPVFFPMELLVLHFIFME